LKLSLFFFILVDMGGFSFFGCLYLGLLAFEGLPYQSESFIVFIYGVSRVFRADSPQQFGGHKRVAIGVRPWQERL
jgi:hypothetical protein